MLGSRDVCLLLCNLPIHILNTYMSTLLRIYLHVYRLIRVESSIWGYGYVYTRRYTGTYKYVCISMVCIYVYTYDVYVCARVYAQGAYVTAHALLRVGVRTYACYYYRGRHA